MFLSPMLIKITMSQQMWTGIGLSMVPNNEIDIRRGNCGKLMALYQALQCDRGCHDHLRSTW